MKHVVKQFTVTATATLLAGPALAAGGSLPQMDQTWFPNQLAWLAITFVAMYLLVSKFVSPRVDEVLSARADTIADAIAKAEQFKQHAEQTRGNAEAGTQHARTQAAELLAKAQADIAKAQADAMASLNATLEQEAAKAAAQLQQAVSASKGDMEKASADLARAIAEKLLGSTVDEASVKAALKAA